MNDGLEDVLILTSNPSAFADFEFARPTQVIAVDPPSELIPTTRLKGERIFRTALEKARAGSRLGAWLERTIKRFAWRLRPTARLTPGRQARLLDSKSIRSSAMYLRLMEEHSSSPIHRLVVFDVFDLPVALAFADDHNVEVLVR